MDLQPFCRAEMPCMWEVFKASSSYAIPNNCVCPPEKKCMLTSDNLSIGAYVYTCQGRRQPWSYQSR
ncbi:unnamed protein product [Darwinula stevensoni]|uniref:Uncharacterized protein n=1 Tax=Darwinula stevensoni TaxID=69355 RepID=A0A7R9FNJ1_9CRUS|nr:unnamed protein product [Darwinula stevensoni]CAG0896518.1 unnamed protein product [Darwinula stevensoni]